MCHKDKIHGRAGKIYLWPVHFLKLSEIIILWQISPNLNTAHAALKAPPTDTPITAPRATPLDTPTQRSLTGNKQSFCFTHTWNISQAHQTHFPSSVLIGIIIMSSNSTLTTMRRTVEQLKLEASVERIKVSNWTSLQFIKFTIYDTISN